VTAAILVVGLTAYRAYTPSSQSLGDITSPAASADHLPKYLRGGKLIASQETANASGVTMTFTPSSRRIGFVIGCRDQTTSGQHPTQGVLTVNAVSALRITCAHQGEGLGLSGDASFGRSPGWHAYGAVPGQPMTVRFASTSGGTNSSVLWRLGAYQAVPLTDYPFPQAPAKPAGLSSSLISHGGGRRLIWDNSTPPNDPNGFTYHVTVRRGLTWLPESVAPGALQMYVNGRLFATYWSWSYHLEMGQYSWNLHELGIKSGTRVSVRFAAQAHQDWWQAFALYDSPRP